MSGSMGYFNDATEDSLKTEKYIPFLVEVRIPDIVKVHVERKKKLFLVKQAKRELAWYERLTCSVDEYTLKEKMMEKIHLRHILGEHTLSIMEWTVMYGRAIEAVNRKNRIFLKDIMKAERLKYIIGLSTSPLCITCLTLTVSLEIKVKVFEEYLEYD
ncbi:hypothetical protein IW261DRAFT_1418361 [Armillaria novae-zelandiae]|uniref:Uncharacterized protein n=1 Tax=Armillaria novae-zelandiae TaxID=153914 RepID=A0AA39PCT4_9AGAR|nr:hypothetical protein IW261DRAFT_1418361 [Armillaria novae-zelandiae]